MPSFHSFVGSATAVTMTDADEFYVRDDSTTSSARLTWASLKTLLSAKYAELAGATFTGAVTVPTPTVDAHAATKKYVDDEIAAAIAAL